MNAERMRDYLLGLPHVVEAQQWGGLLYWVGDKAIGGKTFAMVNLEATGGLPISFSAGPERFAELVELEGIRPAPYSAKNFWVAAERWDVVRDREWEQELTTAHNIVFAKLPPRTRTMLAMSKGSLKKLVAERKALLAARDAASSARLSPSFGPATHPGEKCKAVPPAARKDDPFEVGAKRPLARRRRGRES